MKLSNNIFHLFIKKNVSLFLENLNKVSTLVKYIYSIEDIFYLLAF